MSGVNPSGVARSGKVPACLLRRGGVGRWPPGPAEARGGWQVGPFASRVPAVSGNSLNIEEPEALVRWLVERGLLAGPEGVRCEKLAGGVSNRTVRVTHPRGAWVVKQALERLRVKDDWFADPARVHREALGLRWLQTLTPPGSVPGFVAEDPADHVLVMEAVPEPHANWKTLLLREGPEPGHVRQFGELLGVLHRRSRERRGELETVFGDRRFFESLRLEPYYRRAAERQPAAASFLGALIDETHGRRLALVHGDYSPKNILVHDGRLVLLDHEVIHWGDPAFDLGFSLTHLLAKALHCRDRRKAFLQAALDYWAAYREAADWGGEQPALEARAVRHTLGCLLARVDGRSPLEYLDEAERAWQRRTAMALMRQPPAGVPGLIETFGRRLEAGGPDGGEA
ncbi:MAG: aminoglycoside phosphotransferase family protein [Verrucomicrobia bacterium]|nr:MAG: aminoglycoside phosphotransferase family protein [Verrucomicrobiota bacterium]